MKFLCKTDRKYNKPKTSKNIKMGNIRNNLIKAKRWNYIKTRKQNWFVQQCAVSTNRTEVFKKFLNINFSLKDFVLADGDEYILESEKERIQEFFQKQIRKDPDLFKKLNKKISDIIYTTQNYILELDETDFNTFTNQSLAAEVINFQKIYISSTIPSWLYFIFFLTNDLEQLFYIAQQSVNFIQFPFYQEYLDMLKISQKIKSENIDLKNLPPQFKKVIEQHKSKYSYLLGSYKVELVEFDIEDLKHRIKYLMSKDLPFELSRVLELEKQINRQSLELKKTKNWIYFNEIKEFIELKITESFLSDKLLYVGRQTILKECADRMHLFSHEIVQLSADEIYTLLNNQQDYLEIIEERNHGFSTLWEEKEVKTIYRVHDVSVNNLIHHNESNIQTILGKGNGGTVEGYLKQVLQATDFSNFEPNDILFIKTADYSMIPLFEKAAGVVTQELGFCSIAYFMTSFLGIPFISVNENLFSLKDGEYVKINGKTGQITLQPY